MTVMTGGDAVYETLKALGVSHVFGIVSVHNIPIYDAILRGGGITPIDVRHEQGGVHAADGYSRATGRLGVAITSTGPGAANAMPGLFEASFASSRVLMITGQIETQYYGKGKGFLHEAENQLPMLRTVTRRAESPRRMQEIPAAIMRVAGDISTGRPQPGAVEIPIDLQYATGDITIPDKVDGDWIAPNDALIEEAAAILSDASRRVIWAGGGVIRSEAGEALVRLAEALDAPVFTTANGRGAIPETHPLSMGTLMQTRQCREVLADAEVVLAVGTRFQGNASANWSFEMPGTLIHIDADPRVINLNYKAKVAIVGDACQGLDGLLSVLGNAGPSDRAFNGRLSKARDEARAELRERIGPDFQVIMDVIRERMPSDGNVVRDATVPAYMWGNQLLPILEPKTSLHSTSAAIGPGLPLAIGAAVGTAKKTVVIQGDGGFMLSIGELATAVQYKLPIIVCLFNDRGYGVLRGIQKAQFDGRTTGVDLATPDFAATARAMGLAGESVTSADAFKEAFARAVEADGPVLLDIDMTALAPMQRMFGQPRRAAS